MKIPSILKAALLIAITSCTLYGSIRLYYAVTGGFTVANITSDLTYDSRWVTHPLSNEERSLIDQALDQEYTYLGKGCQAYVFLSQDGNYVLKFFKYQRFRPQSWINLFTFIPAIDRYQKNKAKKKKERLDDVFRSWKIAYEDLNAETGVVYVHLNKSDHLNKTLKIYDKLGLTHHLDLDQMEFLVQHRASMLGPTIKRMIDNGEQTEVKLLLDNLLTMLVSEYYRGFADNDHALMQNTGVWSGKPIHMDVGQFIHNDVMKKTIVHNNELFDKTYKLRFWLKKYDPGLSLYLENRLAAIIGEDYFLRKPYVHKSDVAKIPNQ